MIRPNTEMFSPVCRLESKLFTCIPEQIQALIIERHLRERRPATPWRAGPALGGQPPLLREALKTRAARSLVEIRHGQGTFI